MDIRVSCLLVVVGSDVVGTSGNYRDSTDGTGQSRQFLDFRITCFGQNYRLRDKSTTFGFQPRGDARIFKEFVLRGTVTCTSTQVVIRCTSGLTYVNDDLEHGYQNRAKSPFIHGGDG